MSFFEGRPVLFWETHYADHEMEMGRPASSAVFETYLLRFLKESPPYRYAGGPREDDVDDAVVKILRKVRIATVLIDGTGGEEEVHIAVFQVFQKVPLSWSQGYGIAVYASALGVATYGTAHIEGLPPLSGDGAGTASPWRALMNSTSRWTSEVMVLAEAPFNDMRAAHQHHLPSPITQERDGPWLRYEVDAVFAVALGAAQTGRKELWVYEGIYPYVICGKAEDLGECYAVVQGLGRDEL